MESGSTAVPNKMEQFVLLNLQYVTRNRIVKVFRQIGHAKGMTFAKKGDLTSK